MSEPSGNSRETAARHLRLMLAITVALVTIALPISLLVTGIGRLGRKPTAEVLLSWTDGQTQAAFELLAWPGAPRRYALDLAVTREGKKRTERLDDYARLGTVSLLRYRQWVLVLNGRYVLGGYDFQTDKLYGQRDWDKLPFTLHGGSGTIVARSVVGETPGARPEGLPSIPDPSGASTATATAPR